MMLKGLHEMPVIKLKFTACKANTLTTILTVTTFDNQFMIKLNQLKFLDIYVKEYLQVYSNSCFINHIKFKLHVQPPLCCLIPCLPTNLLDVKSLSED